MTLNGPFSPWPSFTESEAAVVSRVLLSNKVNYWTGDEGLSFEQEFSDYVGTSHAIAVANGTVALELALRATGVGAGDEVIVPSRTFVATGSAVTTVGAIPVFADVDRDSQNITAESIAEQLTERTRAIICVHLAGWPCDMEAIMGLAEANNLKVIEDCAQAHGARIGGRSVGSFGDIGCWSFCQDKIISTCGEGGMLTTNNDEMWSRLWSGKDHGKSWEAVHERKHGPEFAWLHESIGTNARLTEIQSAVGRWQLTKLPEWTTRRNKACRMIWDAAAELVGLRIPVPAESVTFAAYRSYVFIDPSALAPGWDRNRIMLSIRERGVPCFSGSCSEIYLEECFSRLGLTPSIRRPVARELGETSLAFLVHPTLSDAEVRQTADALYDTLNEACR
ncbi:DegT/DnrJ/EryC1/StrS aminotransferase family protein [Myxococcota bacterium]|nr:DegT/DnrJ/EryC1/StrS aminotransferase family protein [Myxococcota bacterium]